KKLALAPTSVSVSASVSLRVKIPPSEPASVTSSPSRIHVAPSETTISQCHRLHGIRSSRAGTYDSIVSPSDISRFHVAQRNRPRKIKDGLLNLPAYFSSVKATAPVSRL